MSINRAFAFYPVIRDFFLQIRRGERKSKWNLQEIRAFDDDDDEDDDHDDIEDELTLSRRSNEWGYVLKRPGGRWASSEKTLLHTESVLIRAL